jgi:aryl-alcohol dehydrogenase-like predicted oxidoreductase
MAAAARRGLSLGAGAVVERALGRTGLKLFPLGLGTVKLGRNRQVKYPEAFELPDQAQAAALLEAALEEGVRLWDTAPAYGLSEERLGPLVKRHRDRIVLCSKCGEEFGPHGSTHDFSGPGCRRSVERSLRRLQTSYLDLCLLHSDGRDRWIIKESGAVETLLRLRDEGKVRAIGISAKSAEGVRLAGEHLDAVMAPLGWAHPELADELRWARSRGCAVLAIKVLDQGHGMGGAGRRARIERALHYVLGHDFVDVAVIGTRSAPHLREAVEIVRGIERGDVRGA